ncbi:MULTISPECIES: hypothetical protein [Paenibacillus]|uniref:Uncharacterized protein n=1 Tax=Paenibacillus ihbetae TaxID=1870820 RepID=A0A1B2E2D7_9BACL|nr:hypothetical protein [Paenibacillus ihbetae]ANY74135.1 hypothetical protein BBD41_16955 [Paenibacillus ihbetae]
MKKIIPVLIVIVINSIYLTEVISQYTIQTVLQLIFVFCYLFILNTLVFYLINKYVISKNVGGRIGLVLVSLCVSIICVLVFNDSLIVKNYKPTSVEIVPSITKNPKSNGSEVWITGIYIDDRKVELKDVPMIRNKNVWTEKEGAIVNSGSQPDKIVFDLPKAQDIRIKFLKHAWSGNISINEGNHKETHDLYSPDSGDYSYTVKTNLVPTTNIQRWISCLFSLIFISSLSFLVLNVIQLKKINKSKSE